jgi:hypothetical protein
MGASLDQLTARNNTKIYLAINGSRVGRVQQMSHDRSNNVQVLSELGRDVAVELAKGITIHTFTIARFFCRNDVFGGIQNGEPFSLSIRDTAASDGAQASTEVLEYFRQCMVQSISRSFTNGQATVAQNATVVAIGNSEQG